MTRHTDPQAHANARTLHSETRRDNRLRSAWLEAKRCIGSATIVETIVKALVPVISV